MARPPMPPRWTQGTGRLLVALVRALLDDAGPGTVPDVGGIRADDADVAGLADAARWHRVAGPVLRASATLPGPAATLVRDVLGHHVLLQRARHAAVLATLGTVAPVLDRAGPWAVLKGPVLAAQQQDLGQRVAGDLDLLVDPDDLPDHILALEAEGWTTAERNWRLLGRLPLGQVHLRRVGPGGRVATELDLHWHLVHHPSVRRRLPIPTGILLAARRPVDLGVVRAPALGPEDLAIHVALHAVLGGLGHLGWLLDLHRARAAAATSALSERAEELGVAMPTAMALRHADAVLGAPPGAEPGPAAGWPRLVAAVRPAALAGAHPAGPIPTLGRVITAASRVDVASSLLALARPVRRAPLDLLARALRRPRLRRFAPLLRHAGRAFPGRALGLARGGPRDFRPSDGTHRTNRERG